LRPPLQPRRPVLDDDDILLPDLAAAGLVFNSTRINSKGFSPVFSGWCTPPGSHWVEPAFTGASTVFTSGIVNLV
jgi:hypothetical protein